MSTRKEFCDSLRKLAGMLASGKLDTYLMTDWDMAHALGDEVKGINSSYIRTIMNRSPDVKAVGTVKVIRSKGDDEAPGFIISLNKEPTRKVVTNDDIPRIQARAVEKFAKSLLERMPNIADLEGDELQGAVKMAGRYQAMIKAEIEQGE